MASKNNWQNIFRCIQSNEVYSGKFKDVDRDDEEEMKAIQRWLIFILGFTWCSVLSLMKICTPEQQMAELRSKRCV